MTLLPTFPRLSLATSRIFLFVIAVMYASTVKQQAATTVKKQKVSLRAPAPKRPPQNLFDCAGVNASCIYFQPSNFFGSGPGQPYRAVVEKYWKVTTESSREDLFLHSIEKDVGVFAYLEWTDNTTQPPKQLPRSMIGIHIHKCGGTSVGRTFGRAEKDFPQYQEVLFYAHNLRDRFGNNWHPAAIDLTRNAVERVEKDQREGRADHVIFSFVREPVSRFLSSVGEFLHSRNKKKICLEATTRDMLHCLLQTLKATGLQLDQHFAPAAVDLYMFSLLGQPARISLLPLNKMGEFRHMFGLPDTRVKSAVSSASYSGYNLSLSDLDADMLRDVCRLYEVDVILMRSLGIETPHCEPYIK